MRTQRRPYVRLDRSSRSALAITAVLVALAVSTAAVSIAASAAAGPAQVAKKKCKKAKRSAAAAKRKCRKKNATPPPTAAPPTTVVPPTAPAPIDIDDPPVAVNDASTINEDAGASAIDVLANDTDPDGGTKAVVSKTDGANGTVAITGGGTGMTYTPNADYCNSPPGTALDTFTYTLNGGSSATVTVTVTCVNDGGPVAVDDTASTTQNTPVMISASTLTANDTDVDLDPLNVTAVQNSVNGTVMLSSGNVTFTPSTDFCGAASFEYVVSDGTLTDVGSVAVAVC